MRQLAQACEHAGLTRVQAEAARLAGAGATYRAIAVALSLRYPQARRTTIHASRKLQAAHPRHVRAQERFLRDVYWCLRNRAGGGHPKSMAIYAPRSGGGYESEPVRLTARRMGELPEDLMGCPLRFLREFARQCAVG